MPTLKKSRLTKERESLQGLYGQKREKRLKLLQAETAEHMKQWEECFKRREHYQTLVKPTKVQRNQYETDEDLSNKLFAILSLSGLFAVKLWNMGECFKGRKTLQVEIYVVITDAIDQSALKAMILHKLSHNVRDGQREDTPQDGFIHVFRSLHNKGDYNKNTKEQHLQWIRKTYGGQRISWVLSNKPLMESLQELMAFEYFEQDGKVPITLYSNWSTNGTRGSVSADNQTLNESVG